jgi:predicted DNA-binding transcriptional regulator AlpA
MDDDLLEPAEVARRLRRPKNWLAKLRITGGGPKFLKIGGAVRYRHSDVEAWLAGCERASTATERAA